MAAKTKLLIKTIAVAKHKDGSPGVSLLIEFKDFDNQIKEVMLPITVVNEMKSLKSALLNNGFQPQVEIENYKLIREKLLDLPKDRVYLVRSLGFHGGAYLASNDLTIGNFDNEAYMIDEETKIRINPVTSNGTLEEWKEFVAKPALNSSRAVLGLCTTASSYLLKVSGIESGGFHIYYDTSVGKSTIIYIVTSFCGSRETMGKWSFSDSGFIQTVAGRNDNIMTLDEIKTLDGEPKQIARKCSKIIYDIALGSSKRLDISYRKFDLTWRVNVLSTGEFSLEEAAERGNVQRDGGEALRVIDMPANVNTNEDERGSIYESLPDGMTGAKFAKFLNDNTKKYFGTPMIAFLEKYTRDTSNDDALVKKRIEDSMNVFMEKHNINESDGPEHRHATRFALAYAGGVFAIMYKVFPYTKKQIMESISKCYIDSLKPQVESSIFEDEINLEKEVAHARKVIDSELKSAGFLDIRGKDHGKTCDDIIACNKLKTAVRGTNVKVLKHKYLCSLVPDERVRKLLVTQYRSEGRLLLETVAKKAGKLVKAKNTRHIAPNKCKLGIGYFFLPAIKPQKDSRG